jgi:hypothetical protein
MHEMTGRSYQRCWRPLGSRSKRPLPFLSRGPTPFSTLNASSRTGARVRLIGAEEHEYAPLRQELGFQAFKAGAENGEHMALPFCAPQKAAAGVWSSGYADSGWIEQPWSWGCSETRFWRTTRMLRAVIAHPRSVRFTLEPTHLRTLTVRSSASYCNFAHQHCGLLPCSRSVGQCVDFLDHAPNAFL